MMTHSDRTMPIVGTGTGCPPLMNGRVFSCRASSTSLTPMKPRITDRPYDRYTSFESSPPSRKYSCRSPISANAFAVNTR